MNGTAAQPVLLLGYHNAVDLDMQLHLERALLCHDRRASYLRERRMKTAALPWLEADSHATRSLQDIRTLHMQRNTFERCVPAVFDLQENVATKESAGDDIWQLVSSGPIVDGQRQQSQWLRHR